MQVLHDWDRIGINGVDATKRGISLLCYMLTRKIPLLNRISIFRENTKRLEDEKIAYMETLIKLDKLVGVISVFGIRDVIRERYGKEIDELETKYGVDVRRHIHIGKAPDPKRKRLWVPPLTQSIETWHFDRKWVKGIKTILKSGELANFHVERPNELKNYIDYLYEVIKK